METYFYNNTLLGKNINNFRKEKNLKQKEFAELLKVDPSTIAKWENGTREPNLEMLLKIAATLSISLYELIGIADNCTSNELILLNYFRSLNDEGQEKLLEQAEFFVSSGKYIKTNESELVQAK